jgi:hypothetical protein
MLLPLLTIGGICVVCRDRTLKAATDKGSRGSLTAKTQWAGLDFCKIESLEKQSSGI